MEQEETHGSQNHLSLSVAKINSLSLSHKHHVLESKNHREWGEDPSSLPWLWREPGHLGQGAAPLVTEEQGAPLRLGLLRRRRRGQGGALHLLEVRRRAHRAYGRGEAERRGVRGALHGRYGWLHCVRQAARPLHPPRARRRLPKVRELGGLRGRVRQVGNRRDAHQHLVGLPLLGQRLRPARRRQHRPVRRGAAGAELLRHGPARGARSGAHDLPGRPARGAGPRGRAVHHGARLLRLRRAAVRRPVHAGPHEALQRRHGDHRLGRPLPAAHRARRAAQDTRTRARRRRGRRPRRGGAGAGGHRGREEHQ